MALCTSKTGNDKTRPITMAKADARTRVSVIMYQKAGLSRNIVRTPVTTLAVLNPITEIVCNQEFFGSDMTFGKIMNRA